MDQLADSYPEECSRVKELIGEAVLYHRENGALSDSTGIAVYVPVDVATDYGLLYYLDYIYDICEDDSVTALYYYKQAGCLSDVLKETVAGISGKELVEALFFANGPLCASGPGACSYLDGTNVSLDTLMLYGTEEEHAGFWHVEVFS